MINLRTKICDALDGAVENLDVEKMYDIEANDRGRLNRSTLEALQFAFNAVFDVRCDLIIARLSYAHVLQSVSLQNSLPLDLQQTGKV